MHIYAIGDLHLSGQPPLKPMSVFGQEWEDHWEKISAHWQAAVTQDDLVIICGDTSWAMKLSEAKADLDAIAALPGRKILVRGNHDYWWDGLAKMAEETGQRLFFLHNNSYADGWLAICGSRGWLTPDAEGFAPADEKIYRRELERVERSLRLAKQAGAEETWLALHYPPLYSDGRPTGFSQLCEKYHVRRCLYGHLHGASISLGWQGECAGTCYCLVSADALGFVLKKIV